MTFLLRCLISTLLISSCAHEALADDKLKEKFTVTSRLESDRLVIDIINLSQDELFVPVSFCHELFFDAIILNESDLSTRSETFTGDLWRPSLSLSQLLPGKRLSCGRVFKTSETTEAKIATAGIIVWNLRLFVGDKFGSSVTSSEAGALRVALPIGSGSSLPVLEDDPIILDYYQRKLEEESSPTKTK